MVCYVHSIQLHFYAILGAEKLNKHGDKYCLAFKIANYCIFLELTKNSNNNRFAENGNDTHHKFSTKMQITF